MKAINCVWVVLLILSFSAFVSAEQYYEFEYNVVRAYEGTWNATGPYSLPAFYFYEITHNIQALSDLKYILVFPTRYSSSSLNEYYFVEATAYTLNQMDENGNNWIYSKAGGEFGNSKEIILKINSNAEPDFTGFAYSDAENIYSIMQTTGAPSTATIPRNQVPFVHRCFEETIPFAPRANPQPAAFLSNCVYFTAVSSQPISELRDLDKNFIGKTLEKYLHQRTGWNPPMFINLPPYPSANPSAPPSNPPGNNTIPGTIIISNNSAGGGYSNSGSYANPACNGIRFEYPSEAHVGESIRVKVISPFVQSSAYFRAQIPRNQVNQELGRGNFSEREATIQVPNNVGENIVLRFSSADCSLSSRSIPILDAIPIVQNNNAQLPPLPIPTMTNLFKRSYKKMDPFAYPKNIPEKGFYLIEGYEGVLAEKSNLVNSTIKETPFGLYYFYYNGLPFLVYDYDFLRKEILTPPAPLDEIGAYYSLGYFNAFPQSAYSYSHFVFELNENGKIDLEKSTFGVGANDYNEISTTIPDKRSACYEDYYMRNGLPFNCLILEPISWTAVSSIPSKIQEFVKSFESIDPDTFTIQSYIETDLNGFSLLEVLERNKMKKLQELEKKNKQMSPATGFASLPVKVDNVPFNYLPAKPEEQRLVFDSVKANENAVVLGVKLVEGNRLVISTIQNSGKILGIIPFTFTYEKSINVYTKQEISQKPWWGFLIIQ